ncbi:phosphate ABC transporter substrate-binding protein PstS [Ancylothrix sp. C2]|uniref:phosphate ABC transporter substrate-binding protein PstS n=1 Tax=Ancylothrix sp. D3o TaxID=2953691 RepID=UPI0021BA5C1A|nr:phosphate ABC transporter substrate-binding protein PstS [Ancylothrix sp. D3o]MCT7950318.1 phosphate ABC transporter substrate-binding protein PstS [Ancylothrix sp. D3o]
MVSQLYSKRTAFVASAIALSFGLASCSGSGTKEAGNTTGSTPAAGGNTPAATTAAGGGQTVRLSGAGATFPAPLYETWFAEYNKKNPNVQISYQSVGSGAGVEQFTKGTVDFGASDTAMKDDEIAKAPNGALMVPMSAGSIVLAYNAPGVTSLKLPRQVYTDIFLGKITKWNDAAIAAANPGVNLPDKAITVVHRSDGSGTTGVFTKHLTAISEDWKNGPGEGKSVSWPVGNGGKGNEGVTELIKQTEGAIGYVEYGYAKNNGLSMATLENKAGKFVEPTPEAAAKTLAAVQLPENFRAFIPDPEGEASYPIVSYTWLLVPKKIEDTAKAQALENVIKWGLTEGQQMSSQLGYVPLPKEVVDKVTPVVDAIAP